MPPVSCTAIAKQVAARLSGTAQSCSCTLRTSSCDIPGSDPVRRRKMSEGTRAKGWAVLVGLGRAKDMLHGARVIHLEPSKLATGPGFPCAPGPAKPACPGPTQPSPAPHGPVRPSEAR